MKAVEIGITLISFFTFTFQYEIGIENEKVGNENEHKLTGYRKRTDSNGNMSKAIKIRKSKTGTLTRRTKYMISHVCTRLIQPILYANTINT